MKTRISNLRLPSLILIFSFLVFLSCTDEASSPDLNSASTDIHVQDGYLVFTSKDQFEETLSGLSKLSKEDLNEWEKKIGFISKRTKINEALDAYAKTTEETIDQVKLSYKDLLLFDDDEFLGSAFPLLQRASLVNENGIVKIGDDLIVFRNDRVITLLGGDFSKLPAAEKVNFENGLFFVSNDKSIMVSKIQSLSYDENSRTKNTSGFIDLCLNYVPSGGVGEYASIKYLSYYESPSLSTGYHYEIFEVNIQAISQRWGPQRPVARNMAFDVSYSELRYIAQNPSVYLGSIQQYNTASQSQYNYILSLPLFSGRANVADSGTFNARITTSYTFTIDGVLKCSGSSIISNLP